MSEMCRFIICWFECLGIGEICILWRESCVWLRVVVSVG